MNRNVTVDGEISKTLLHPAGLRPSDFEPIDLGSFADAQHQTRIMRRKITASADLHAASFQIAGLVTDAGADGIDVRLLTYQLQPEPVVLAAGVIAQEHWRF